MASLFETVGDWRQPPHLSLWSWFINYDTSGLWNPKQLSKKEDVRPTWAVKEKPLRYIVRWEKKQDAKLCREYSHLC